MNNKVFYQHPNLMRVLGMHETVMEVMVNVLGTEKSQVMPYLSRTWLSGQEYLLGYLLPQFFPWEKRFFTEPKGSKKGTIASGIGCNWEFIPVFRRSYLEWMVSFSCFCMCVYIYLHAYSWACSHTCGCTCVGVYAQLCIYTWRPEVDINSLPRLLPILFMETGSFPELRCHKFKSST